MFKNGYLTLCILTIIIRNIQAQLKLRERNFGKLYYDNKPTDRRWFIKSKKFKYILLWTIPHTATPFNALPGSGMEPFTKANCSHSNCILTLNNTPFRDPRYFDAIIFHGPDFWFKPSLFDKLPAVRLQTQKYIFYSMESAGYYPLCDEEFDNFFNLTWTYKLNSDLPSPYLMVKNDSGVIIGPKQEMYWKKVNDMLPIDSALKEKLETKTKAVGWLVSACTTASKWEIFVKELRATLAYYYRLDIDIYGKCNYKQCGRPELMLSDCWELIQTDYYFYLSFENSFDEDYVTEEVLNPLQHYTVPIVYGTANYTRFLPDGTYLNAKELGVTKLANEINDIIKNKERYYSFFKWHNHYSFHDPFASPETNPLCSLCRELNKRARKKTHKDFGSWWNRAGVCPTKRTKQTTTRGFLFL